MTEPTQSNSEHTRITADTRLQFPLRPQPFLNEQLVGVLIGVALGALVTFLILPDDNLPLKLSITLGVALVFVALVLALRKRVLAKNPAPIVFTSDYLEIPKNASSAKTVQLTYDQLTGIDIRQRKRKKLLVIATKTRNYIFPAQYIEGGSVEEVCEAAKHFVCAHSQQGERRWHAIMEKRELTAQFLSRKTPATNTLLLLLAVIFVLELALNAGDNSLVLIKLGANVPLLVAEGQWYRIFSANFLHLGFAHIYFNALALYFLGLILERLLGTRKFLIVYLCACVAGSALSTFYASAMMSVGASTGIFGLLGSFAYINLIYRNSLPAGFTQSPRWWLLILGINAALPLLVPQIDWLAHLGGFFGGILATWCVISSRLIQAGENTAQRAENIKDSTAIELATALIVGLFLYSAFAVITRFDDQGHSDINKVMAQLALQKSVSLPMANFIAWNIATDRNANPNMLQTAYDLMQISWPQLDGDISSKDRSAYLDTLASLQYRLGETETAVANEYEALRLNPNRFHASQLSRFLAAANKEYGVIGYGEITSSSVYLDQTRVSPRINLNPSFGNANPVAAIVHVRSGQRRIGYLFCRFVDLRQMSLTKYDELFNVPLDELNFEIGLLDVTHDWKTADDCRLFPVDGLDYVPTEPLFGAS